MQPCAQCQTPFKPNRINKSNPPKFCSRNCYNIDAISKKSFYNCIHCDKLTTNPKFCGRSCSASYNNIKKPKRIKKYQICPTCGIITDRRKYCSDKCNPKRLKLTDEEKLFYTRAKKNEAWARYMSRRKYQTPADEDIKSLQEFYLKCPKGYEVDHIIPISKGGMHSLSNLQYLTRSENRKKSNKI
jgi:5-methylcytosine-specific restriction endonuclease McrA